MIVSDFQREEQAKAEFARAKKHLAPFIVRVNTTGGRVLRIEAELARPARTIYGGKRVRLTDLCLIAQGKTDAVDFDAAPQLRDMDAADALQQIEQWIAKRTSFFTYKVTTI